LIEEREKMSDRRLVANRDAVLSIRRNGSGWVSERAYELEDAECVAFDPRDPRLIFAGSFGQGLHRSADGGATWERLDFPEGSVMSLAVSPADGAIYAGTEPTMLFRSRDGGESWVELEALRHLPSAPGWKFPPRPWTHHLRQIAPDPNRAEVIVAGVELGGVMRSEDDGVTWRDHAPGAIRDCHGLIFHPTAPGRVYEAGGGGSAWSRDGGVTWERVDEGREAHYRHYLTGVATDPGNPDVWFVSASPTPWHGTNANAAIYRKQGGGEWEQCRGDLPGSLDSYPFSLCATEAASYAGLKDGRLYAGFGHGLEWSLLEVRGEPVGDVRQVVAHAE
jgi:hypothetical protein